MKISKVLPIFCNLVFLLSACVGRNAVGEVNLEGNIWVLTTINGIDPLDGRRSILEFEAGEVSGNTGCNHYGGSYQIEADSIHFAGLFNTEMACLEPEGFMEQEQTYLELLRSANRFELVDGTLTLFTATGQSLVFEIQQENPEDPMVTLDPPTSSPPSTFVPPAGFKEYQDDAAGVLLYIPESWVVTGVIPGQSAIFQSYPMDKYVGGEVFEPGDTKCDLNIRTEGGGVEDLIQQWKSNSINTILSESEITLLSGQYGIQIEMESMGRSNSVVTEVNERVVVLTCFGDFTQFDEIALTMSASR